mmetsp:Transcript_17009/g.27627  ORF Transcript_17009/g.27627 Transcript_17009/m.27627 type:complete len:216 (-) Transcript_17009:192-839(-)
MTDMPHSIASAIISGICSSFPPNRPANNPASPFLPSSSSTLFISSPKARTAILCTLFLANPQMASHTTTQIPLRINSSSLMPALFSICSDILLRLTRCFSSSTLTYIQIRDFEMAHHAAMAESTLSLLLVLVIELEPSSLLSGGARRLLAVAPASSIDPPAFSMAARVSAVSAMGEEVDDGAEMTNHLTEPPRRAASMEAISPMPPGGEITTTSG